VLKCFFSHSLYFTNKVLCPHYRDCFFVLFYRLVFIWLYCLVSYARCCTVLYRTLDVVLFLFRSGLSVYLMENT
jgi:uncharacterized membrane protein